MIKTYAYVTVTYGTVVCSANGTGSCLQLSYAWGPFRQTRDAARAEAAAASAAWVARLRPREVLLVGASIYWCEGTKAKP
jgi:hypothetical protein